MSRRVPDESSFRSRPSKRGSRPRTKQRPDHADAVGGFVTGVDRGRYTLLIGSGDEERTVTAMKARELTRTRVVCGDRVEVVGDSSGAAGTLARIVRISERTSVLRRTADDTDPYERIIVANADQLVIVTALAQPEPRTRMIDRCVVAAYDAGMDVLLCLTKADLADPTTLRDLYEPVGVRVVVTRREPHDAPPGWTIAPLDEVREALTGRTSVFVGHSGVGKSTLVNALVPDAMRATGHVNDVTGRGRHTSTSAVALRLPSDAAGTGAWDATVDRAGPGWVIDTPGVRSFGLAHVEVAHLLRAFDDLDAVAAECPRGCTHLADAPDCALDGWVAAAPDAPSDGSTAGEAGPAGEVHARRAARVESFRRLLGARSG